MLFYDFQSTVCNKMPSLLVVDSNPMDEDAMIVDRKLEKEITAFNAAFIQKQILFDQTLLKFVYDDMIQSNCSIRQYKLIIQVFWCCHTIIPCQSHETVPGTFTRKS